VLKVKDRIQNGRLCLRQTFWFSPGSADRLIGFRGKSRMFPVAQHSSGISILGMGHMGVIGVMRLMGRKHKTKNSSAQRNSIMSNLVLTPNPLRPLRLNLFCAQQDSKMSNRRLFRKTAPAQRGSRISILEVLGILRSLGILGILGEQPKEQYGCAQRGSENSKLDFPLCLAGCQASPAMRDDSVVKAVQRDSGISNLGTGEQGIITVSVKNKVYCFMVRLGNVTMSKMQNGPAQRHSKMSNMKIEIENSLPQRHSKMSNGRLSGVLCCPHGQKGMSIMQVKNIDGRFMGVMRIMGQRHKIEIRPAQRGSGMSIFGSMGERVNESMRKTENKTRPAQRDSGMSILTGRQTGLISPTSPTAPQCSPAQRDSGISNLKAASENAPAQQDSGISKLATHPLCPYCPSCPLVFKFAPALAGSKIVFSCQKQAAPLPFLTF